MRHRSFGFLLIMNSIFFFFFNDTATTEIYTLSLHDALPILREHEAADHRETERLAQLGTGTQAQRDRQGAHQRSEEHTSELQSPCNLVCRLLLEKKKKTTTPTSLLEAIFSTTAQSVPHTSCS